MTTPGRNALRGQLLAGTGPSGMAGPVEIVVEDGLVASVTPCSARGADAVVCPGFVDLQVNGVDDVDIASAAPDDWRRAEPLLAASGVTAWLPTLITAPLPVLDRRIAAIDVAAEEQADRWVPRILGAHLEGPFLGSKPGAHPRGDIVALDHVWLASLPSIVRLVTLGAEADDVPAGVGDLVARGVVVSLGHTAPTLAAIDAAVAAGASMVTHLFNAMGPLHHRSPGLVGAALTDLRLSVGLIADGVHVDASLFPLVFAAAADRVVLVTDSVGWQSPTFAALDIAVVDGAPRLADRTIAGSALSMDAAVRNCVDAGVPLAAAVVAASVAPAAVLGDEARGRLVPGRRADVVVLDPDSLAVTRTLVAGHLAHGA